MLNITDPVTQGALLMLISVVMATLFLIALAFLRRWQQIRYARYVHGLQRKYRPVLAALLRGEGCAAGVQALRGLPLNRLEILLDPLLSKRKLSPRQTIRLERLCADLGLIARWQSRLSNGLCRASLTRGGGGTIRSSDRAVMRHPLRAKSIQNLGKLRHRESCELLIEAVNDPHPDIQLVALRALASLGTVEAFPELREQLHRVVQGECCSPPLNALKAAMASFDLHSAPHLAPSLQHPDHRVRLQGMKILKTIVGRQFARQPDLALTPEMLTPPLMELLLTELPVDRSAEIRARAAEVVVFLADARGTVVLSRLLRDDQWFVRLRTVRALSRRPRAGQPLLGDVRECLHDPHWRVREAAIQTLIALGPEGKQELYEYFLTSPSATARKQIVEALERTGLMAALVEDYCDNIQGLHTLVVEQLAADEAILGLSGIVRSLRPEGYRKFLDRFLPRLHSPQPSPEQRTPEAHQPGHHPRISATPWWQVA